MDRKIRILPSFTGVSTTVICFETQVPSVEIREYTTVFEHHGSSYHPIFDAGSLRMFYERMMLGQSFPNTLVLTRWWRIDQIVAAALFLTPSLVLSPECMGLVNTIDTVDRLGSAAMSHIPVDHKILIGALRKMCQKSVSDTEAYRTLVTCTSLVVQYIEKGIIPPVSNLVTDYNVVASIGCVVAFTSKEWAWDRVWMEGALCGLWVKENGAMEIRTKSDLVTPTLTSLNLPDFTLGEDCLIGKGHPNTIFDLLVRRFRC